MLSLPVLLGRLPVLLLLKLLLEQVSSHKIQLTLTFKSNDTFKFGQLFFVFTHDLLLLELRQLTLHGAQSVIHCLFLVSQNGVLLCLHAFVKFACFFGKLLIDLPLHFVDLSLVAGNHLQSHSIQLRLPVLFKLVSVCLELVLQGLEQHVAHVLHESIILHLLRAHGSADVLLLDG